MSVVDVAGWEDRAVLRAVEVCVVLGITRQTLYRWSKDGNFPPSVRLGPGTIGFRVADLKAWLESRPETTHQ